MWWRRSQQSGRRGLVRGRFSPETRMGEHDYQSDEQVVGQSVRSVAKHTIDPLQGRKSGENNPRTNIQRGTAIDFAQG